MYAHNIHIQTNPPPTKVGLEAELPEVQIVRLLLVQHRLQIRQGAVFVFLVVGFVWFGSLAVVCTCMEISVIGAPGAVGFPWWMGEVSFSCRCIHPLTRTPLPPPSPHTYNHAPEAAVVEPALELHAAAAPPDGHTVLRVVNLCVWCVWMDGYIE